MKRYQSQRFMTILRIYQSGRQIETLRYFRSSSMNNTKLNVYKKVLHEVCEKFNGAEQYIEERIEELCSESKLSVYEVTYLFMNDYDHF